jgi:hypothetical protein
LGATIARLTVNVTSWIQEVSTLPLGGALSWWLATGVLKMILLDASTEPVFAHQTMLRVFVTAMLLGEVIVLHHEPCMPE